MPVHQVHHLTPLFSGLMTSWKKFFDDVHRDRSDIRDSIKCHLHELLPGASDEELEILMHRYGSDNANCRGRPTGFLDQLPDGPFLHICAQFNKADLCRVDAAGYTPHTMQRNVGAWRQFGERQFDGIELSLEGCKGGFVRFDEISKRISSEPTKTELVPRAPSPQRSASPQKNKGPPDWKGRCAQFEQSMTQFRGPYEGTEVTSVTTPDAVAYFKATFNTELLKGQAKGIYIEVAVTTNADNISLAVVDFDAGGKSSVSFSPDTGAVIKETKICEYPRKVRGAYTQTIGPTEGRFEGCMGMYLKGGLLAFSRKVERARGGTKETRWETTGFVIDVSWAHGSRLTPCLAFRDEGNYKVCISRCSDVPPFEPPEMTSVAKWTTLDWDGEEHALQNHPLAVE